MEERSFCHFFFFFFDPTLLSFLPAWPFSRGYPSPRWCPSRSRRLSPSLFFSLSLSLSSVSLSLSLSLCRFLHLAFRFSLLPLLSLSSASLSFSFFIFSNFSLFYFKFQLPRCSFSELLWREKTGKKKKKKKKKKRERKKNDCRRVAQERKNVKQQADEVEHLFEKKRTSHDNFRFPLFSIPKARGCLPLSCCVSRRRH